jgi:hypothetical protein
VIAPGPRVHPDLAPLVSLTGPHQNRAAPGVEIGLGEIQRLLNPQATAPKHHDDRA